MTSEKFKVPVWFWVLATAMFLWNIMGVMSFVMHVFIPEATMEGMSDAEMALYDQYPAWTKVAFAVATLGGFLGCIGLLARKAWSKPMFIASLIGIVAQMSHSLMYTDHLDVYGPGGAIMPIMIVAIGALLVYLSNRWIRIGWLK